MMYWWGDQMNGWGWAMMAISSIAFWALVIAGIIALVRFSRTQSDQRTGPPNRATPEQMLAERFARGDIDETEYRRRLEVLGDRPAPRV